MDLARVLQELHEELENLDAAIRTLEKLQETGKRRGRPPAWLAAVNGKKTARKRKPRHDPKVKPPEGSTE